MSQKKKIAAFIILFISCLPMVLIFNDDGETVYYNFIGLAYGVLLFKFGRAIAPKFVLDYIDTFGKSIDCE